MRWCWLGGVLLGRADPNPYRRGGLAGWLAGRGCGPGAVLGSGLLLSHAEFLVLPRRCAGWRAQRWECAGKLGRVDASG